MQQNTIKQQKEELRLVLRKLKRQQDLIQRKIINIEVKLRLLDITNNSDSSSTSSSESDQSTTSQIDRTGLKLGSLVRIANPSRNQQNEGIVIGITNAGFIKVQTRNGGTLRRIPNNLILLNDT